MDSVLDNTEAHYAQQTIEADILSALIESGIRLDQLRPEDFTAIDEFHIGGRKATLALAQKIALKRGMQVLDIGSGLGGASRYLALEFGCRVTGLDLSKKYCDIAGMLTRQFGLDSQVCYRHGNAVEMPFDKATFDVLWTQHITMNIPDKAALYMEMWRVLKPGGFLASYEILAGVGGSVHFPVPWARTPATSFLQTPEHLQCLLDEIGFEIRSWQDKTEWGRLWFQNMSKKVQKQSSKPLGLHLLLGSEFKMMAQNQIRNLEEGRITVIELIVRRPPVNGH